MASNTRDPDYTAEKRNTISETNIYLKTRVPTLDCVNGTLTFVSSK